MNALKCDRCGAYCDVRSNCSEVKITIVTTENIIFKVFEKDFCPSCTEDLKKWINNEATILERDPGADNDMVGVPPSDATGW